MTDAPWFAGLDPDDVDGAVEAIADGSATEPADWPARAVEQGFAADEQEYYDRLHRAAVRTARSAAQDRERAADQQLIHAIRALDDTARTANELAERLAEWAGAAFDDDGSGIEYARTVADRAPTDPVEERIGSLAERVVSLDDERVAIEDFVRQQAQTIAPNLTALAGPVLAARLIALAGGLESLAKKPAGTIQVLGAEDALFAHLQGRAPSPKHGVIYVHEYVSGTRPDERGSAARALAGKLAIAARIDHYAGDRRPELEAELTERIQRIRTRGDG